MVMPRSRSISIESSIWAFMSRVGHSAGHLDEPVGEGGFAVVDMGHDGEVADLGKLGHGRAYSVKGKVGKGGDARRMRRTA
jgi:hypothetical protein